MRWMQTLNDLCPRQIVEGGRLLLLDLWVREWFATMHVRSSTFSFAGEAFLTISVTCAAPRSRQGGRAAHGRSRVEARASTLVRHRRQGSIGCLAGCEGKGSKKKDTEFDARAATNLTEICVVWHQLRIEEKKF